MKRMPTPYSSRVPPLDNVRGSVQLIPRFQVSSAEAPLQIDDIHSKYAQPNKVQQPKPSN